MEEATPLQFLVCFGEYQLDTRAGDLHKGDVTLRLHKQPLQVLLLLLEHPGELVTREELHTALWPDHTFVDFEDSLNHAIRRLRQALGDSAENPRFIETLPRHGYRFIHPVDPGVGLAPPKPVQPKEPLGRRRLIALGAGAIVAALSLGFFFNVAGLRSRLRTSIPVKSAAALPRIKSIAVLPFDNLSRDPAQEYFADGMTEELITNLGQVGSLRVISRTSAMHYKGTQRLLPEIARELAVDAVVEGTVQRSGNKVRITAQLLRANPETHLWGESYEREVQDVLALQSEIARAIVNEIKIKATVQEQARLESSRPVNPAAYEAYLMGRHFWSLNFDKIPKALEYFEKATQLDPTFAPAYGGAALCYTTLDFPWRPKEVFPRGTEAATKALQLDPELAEAHAALGFAKMSFEWDWAGAEREFRRAIELNPGSPDAHWMYAAYLTMMRRFDEAAGEAKKARQTDPFSPIVNDATAWVSLYARRYDDAIAQFKSTLELVPGYEAARYQLAWCYILKGMYPEAYGEFNGLGVPLGDVFLGYLDAVTGKKARALKAAEILERTAQHEYVDAYNVAILYSGLGDNDEALVWLEKAFADRSSQMPGLNIEPFFDSLRSDRRFQELGQRMNFPK